MPKLSGTLRDAMAAVPAAMLYMDIYSGTIPATGDTSPTGTKLVSWTGTLAWTAGSAGSGIQNISGTPISSDTAVATGTAGYARIWDGTTSSIYCTVGTSGAEVNLSTLTITSGGIVTVTSGSVTMPAT